MQKLSELKAKVDSFNKLKEKWEDILTLIEISLEENDDSVQKDIEKTARRLKMR
jgi:hypothetical protein